MNRNKQQGATLMELTVTMLIISFMVVTLGTIMMNCQNSWVDSYRKVHGGAADDAGMAQAVFQNIVRKASRSKYLMNDLDDLTVYYYEDWLKSEYPDRYARFYRPDTSPGELYVEHGTRDKDDDLTKSSVIQICSTVQELEFRPTNGGIGMSLVLNDGRESTAVMITALLHNE